MAGQAEAGDVGQRMHAVQRGQLGPGRVELRRRSDHPRIAGSVEALLLQRRAEDAHAQRLAQHQDVARAGVGVAAQLARVDQAEHDQAVDRLDRVDAVAAGDRDAGGAADAGAAVEDAPDGRRRQHLHRHADDGQGHDRLAAHRVDVADRVGRRDAAEVVRVVDDRHEEVGRRDQRRALVDLVDRGVVGGLDADQQLRRQRQRRAVVQDAGEHARGKLAAAAATVRERGQPRFGGGGRVGHAGSGAVLKGPA